MFSPSRFDRDLADLARSVLKDTRPEPLPGIDSRPRLLFELGVKDNKSSFGHFLRKPRGISGHEQMSDAELEARIEHHVETILSTLAQLPLFNSVSFKLKLFFDRSKGILISMVAGDVSLFQQKRMIDVSDWLVSHLELVRQYPTQGLDPGLFTIAETISGKDPTKITLSAESEAHALWLGLSLMAPNLLRQTLAERAWPDPFALKYYSLTRHFDGLSLMPAILDSVTDR